MLKKDEKSNQQVVKKWREKDKKQLFEQVKFHFLMLRKMRLNISRINPKKESKRIVKDKQKKEVKVKKFSNLSKNTGGQRRGLRSSLEAEGGEGCEGDVEMIEQTE
jgi:hypothetical protein